MKKGCASRLLNMSNERRTLRPFRCDPALAFRTEPSLMRPNHLVAVETVFQVCWGRRPRHPPRLARSERACHSCRSPFRQDQSLSRHLEARRVSHLHCVAPPTSAFRRLSSEAHCPIVSARLIADIRSWLCSLTKRREPWSPGGSLTQRRSRQTVIEVEQQLDCSSV